MILEEVLRDTPWSKVVRQTEGEEVRYFKTVAPALRHEITLHEALAQRHPDLVPAPLTVNEKEGQFTLPDAGPLLRESVTTADWEVLLPLYARFQRAELEQVEGVLALGVPDRRPTELLTQFPGLPGLTELVEQVNAGPVPCSLNHGDLHDGNVFRGGAQGYRILDWGDASIGHPFCSLRTAMVSMEIRFEWEENDPRLDPYRDLYLAEWTDLAPLPELQALEKKVRPLASLTSALTWRLSLSCATPEQAAPFSHVDGALLDEYAQGLAAL